MNVEMEPQVGDGENWTNGKVRKTKSTENSASAIMKILKNGSHFINIDCMEKFQITDPPKFVSLVFWVSMKTEYQCQPLWKNWKMAFISLISIVLKNFILPTPQSLGLWFSRCQQKRNISVSHYEKIEKWLSFH